MTIRYTHSLNTLTPWKDQWDELAAACGLPMLNFAWFLAAEQCLAEPDSVRVVYVLDADDTLVAACALELRCNGHGRYTYQILGMPRLYEPSSLLFRNVTACSTLITALSRLDYPVVLARLWPLDSSVNFATNRWKLSRHALMLNKYTAPSQYLELTRDYDQFIKSLPSKRRYDLHRAYRRAESAGKLTCNIVRPMPNEIDAVLVTAFEIEARCWKGRQGCAVLANAELRDFFFSLLREQAAKRRSLIAMLYSNSIPIAMQVCLLNQQRLWLLKIGYDEAYARQSPGLILMNEVIKYSYQEELDGIEFLGSAEDWLDAWRPALRHYYLLALYPYSLRSLSQLGLDVAGALQRGVRRSIGARAE